MTNKQITLQEIYNLACQHNMQNAVLHMDISNMTLPIPGTNAELHITDMDGDCPINYIHFFKAINYCAPKDQQNEDVITLEYITPDNQRWVKNNEWQEENEDDYWCGYMSKTYF